TGSGPPTALEIARLRSSTVRRMPSPVVPRSRIPPTPASLREMRYGSRASSSSAAPSSRSGVSAAAIVLAIAAMLLVGEARASDLLDVNAQDIKLEVHGKRALVEYRADGDVRHVLVWGAISSRTP